jgi:hypothetical protein
MFEHLCKQMMVLPDVPFKMDVYPFYLLLVNQNLFLHFVKYPILVILVLYLHKVLFNFFLII